MLLDQETLRFIFGFKLRGLRQEKNLPLKTLAQMTGLSPSYINEIEKGKKYPKGDKILLLARSLGVSYDDLTSIKLKKELGIIAQILGNNMIRGLPFDIFGIPARTLFELMAEQPQNFSTLVGTVLELARNYNITVEDFFAATLRAYLDMNNNYFPELEKSAAEFRKHLESEKVPLDVNGLRRYLTSSQGYEILERNFESADPALRELHFYAVPGSGRGTKLFLNSALSEKEMLFLLARECGYARLQIKDRLNSNIHLNLDSFEALRGNFRASYFASSLLIPQDSLIVKIKELIAKPKWDQRYFTDWLGSSVEPIPALFHRISQILPDHFGLEQMFFLRFDYNPQNREYRLLRELHLSELHAPHEVKAQGNYCRRWITTSLLEGLASSQDEFRAGIQRSRYFGTDKEYLCFSAAYRKELESSQVECVTIGIRVDEELEKRVRFLGDPAIPVRTVSDACENCRVEDCKERVAPAIHARENSFEKVEKALEKLVNPASAR